MSVKTEKKNRGRMSQTKIDDLLREIKGEQPIVSITAEPQNINEYDSDCDGTQTISKPMMHNNYEYDSMQPEARLKEFAAKNDINIDLVIYDSNSAKFYK